MEADRFLQSFDSSDLKTAQEFLTSCLPFLSKGLCEGCSAVLHDRIRSLYPGQDQYRGEPQTDGVEGSLEGSVVDGADGTWDEASSVEEYIRGSPERCVHIEHTAQQEELRKDWRKNIDDVMVEKGEGKLKKTELSREHREWLRFTSVGRKKDFVYLERLDRRMVNILEGLELHTGVFSAVEQKRIVDFVYDLQEKGRNNEFGEHTYSEPRKWMRGKGRVTIQFGCCYNYAEKDGIPPGIIRHVIADPIPMLFKTMIRRLIGWHVMPTYCVPDSCIVNIYEPGDCIPPHIDNHDFVRPFSTVSFLSECNIVFGSKLKIAGPGEFIGSTSIPLPVGSVLVLNGNGADVAKHCVPAVPYKRISITFRKMDKVKWPLRFRLEPDLQNIKPYDLNARIKSQQENKEKEPSVEIRTTRRRKLRGRPEPDLQNIRPYDLSAGIESQQKNGEKKSSVEIRMIRSKSLISNEAEELVERSLRHGSMNDYGGNSIRNKVSSERRVQMQ